MNAKQYIQDLLQRALRQEGLDWPEKATVEPPREKEHGDMASNAALVLASSLGRKPRDLAQSLREQVSGEKYLDRVEVAGPGFLNFFLKPGFWHQVLSDVFEQGSRFGVCNAGQGERVLVEYVSANPTGPLHIGHGRGAAVGDSLVRILRFTGYDVDTEYYVNDSGRQIQLLGRSILLRYKDLHGEPTGPLPEDCYQGEYIRDLARELRELRGSELLELSGERAETECAGFGLKRILEQIRTDLREFGAEHAIWYRESSLTEEGGVERTMDQLRKQGLVYERDGALWFESTRYGDDKDRVLRKSDGELTYFAADVAYHADKFERGYDRLINVWGADHHGYVPRMRSAVQALGRSEEDLQLLLVQMVNLLRGGEYVSMSTRAGEFVTLAEVCREVGTDAARFIFLSHKSDSHLDFDLDLVKEQSMDNPVYYVQYAHARICSVFKKARERGYIGDQNETAALSRLEAEEELVILKLLDRFPEMLQGAARTLSPHHLSFYLRDLAGAFHSYYNKYPVLVPDEEKIELCRDRLALLNGIAQVLRNGLSLLGVRAPETM
jgi:arginyl-tRNA synthetase